ncbi:MAG: ADOP family duplicated permease [Gemmatimonas sp.]
MTRSPRSETRSPLSKGWRRLTQVWKPQTVSNIDDELQFHFEQKIAEFQEQGATFEAARARAVEEFGDVQRVKMSLREIDERVESKQRRAEWSETVVQDLRYVVRSLRRSPAFATMVIVTMALGLGANAAIFSVLDRLYVQPPAGISDPASIHRLSHTAMNRGEPYVRSGFANVETRALRAAAPAGITIASYSAEKMPLGRSVSDQRVGVSYVEGDYFAVSGVTVALGRTFSSEESGIAGLSPVAIISQALWERQYAKDPDIIGRTIDLGSHRHVIVGVTRGNFRGLDVNVSDVFVPMNTIGIWKDRKADWFESKNFNGNRLILRATNPASVAVFNTRATAVLRDPVVSLMRDSLSTTSVHSIIDARGNRRYGQEMAIGTRLGGVALAILLIACANVINLMLARAAHRKREIAVRIALGVSRTRLFLHLLMESAVLALVSAGVALLVAAVSANTLRRLLLPDIDWGTGVVDSRVVAFTVALALLSGIVVGLLPALQTSNPNLSQSLRASVRDGGGRRSALRSSLLITQAALSVILLVGAGVFVRSLRTVESVDTGFDIDQLAYVTVGFDRELENRSADIRQQMPQALERVRQIPGVESVALSGNVPMYGFSFEDLFLPGRDSLPPAAGMDRILSYVSPEYYRTVGMRVLRGRAFTDADRSGSEPVMAMNENMARNLWPGEDALTKCVIVGTRESPCRRVVAIVSPAHFSSVIEAPSMMYYLPIAQAEPGRAGVIVIRSAPGQSPRIGREATLQLQSLFGDWSRPRLQTMEEVVGPQMRPWRVGAALFTSAGMLALLVAAVGVYSSIAYTMSQRSQEIGVRIALGASVGNIMRTVTGEGVRVIAIGIGIGVIAALALGSVVASLLYETSPRDPYVMVTSAAMLLVVTVIACAIPAWRASRIDPLNAMRAE